MSSPAGWRLENTYASLGPTFHARLNPETVASPQLVVFNQELAQTLGLDPSALAGEPGARIFSGNEIPPGATPIAQAYAGHQYGHFTRLGDGRAIVLGEQIDPRGLRWDIQLKGSGPTPYSRRGDGRAALGPMLREYLISEAMFALGIPTTRSLAVAATGEPVRRETLLPGAVLTRVAKSHIRVGTFEYAATMADSGGGLEAVRKLADYAIDRHAPECRTAENPYVEFLRTVIARQGSLLARWMQVGFVHGVMNTDNMLVSGETIDYGPCAFLDQYDPETVFSSIDEHGRYAYGNQPPIAHWNLARLAEALLPLFHTEERAAIELAQACLADFPRHFSENWLSGMRAKLGLTEPRPEDPSLIENLLELMHRHRLDFTNTFRGLADNQIPALTDWKGRWESRRASEAISREQSQALMDRTNPHVIPRNHRVEAALLAATGDQDLEPFRELLSALQRPFADLPEHQPYRDPAPAGSEPYRTFCGT